jgi:hypothetical protein
MNMIQFSDLELDEVVVGFNEHVTTNHILTLSHGQLPTLQINKKQCIIPKNIILHQYTFPCQTLHPTQVDSISNFLEKNSYTKYSKTFYTVNKNGEIRDQKIVSRTMHPGQKTTNLELLFDQTVKNFTMGLSCNFNNPVQLGLETRPVTCTLEQMMNKISTTFPFSFIHLHQLSCRNGNINSLDDESRDYENKLHYEYMFEETFGNYWVFNTEHEAYTFSKQLNINMEIN